MLVGREVAVLAWYNLGMKILALQHVVIGCVDYGAKTRATDWELVWSSAG